MKKLITAVAAAAVLTAHGEPVGFVRVIGQIFTAAAGLQTLIEVWDLVMERWFKPPLKASELWLCTSCNFSPPGQAPMPDDHVRGDAFIKAAFPSIQWQPGQGVIVCGVTASCFVFQFDGSNFYAVDKAIADPHVGYANPGGITPRGNYGGGSSFVAPSTGWSNMFYTPSPRTGSVTVICCDTIGPADSLEPPSTSFGQ